MLNAHKSKTDLETQPNLSNKQQPQPYACQRKKQKQSFQNCSKYEKQRESCYLKQNKNLQKKQSIHPHLKHGRCAWRTKLYA